MITSLTALNRAPKAAFVAALADIFERSPWVAERAADARPFSAVGVLHDVMVAVVRDAGRDEQLDLIRAHPDLAGKAARAGSLTAASRGEQGGVGLDRLSDAEFARFDRLNRAYREKFGFPFIIAVKGLTAGDILNAFERRLTNGPEQEREAALDQIARIARFRLNALLGEGEPDAVVGRLTTHVLDTARGRPAAGLRITLSRVEPDGGLTRLCSVVTNADGRTDRPLLDGDGFAPGRYELLFEAGRYFAAQGTPLADPPFLDEIPIRFALPRAGGHHHVPLLVSPWSYATYRGS